MSEKEPPSAAQPTREGPDSVALSLRRAREALGLTTREVAARIGVSPSFITLIETGRKRPGPETARALAGVLGLPEAPLMAWVEMGGRYDRKSRATEMIAHYLRLQDSQRAPEQAKPRSRALLMMSRLLGGSPREPLGRADTRFYEAMHRAESTGAAAVPPLPPDALSLIELPAGEPRTERHSGPRGHALLRVPILAEGADPAPPGSTSPRAIDWVVIDQALLPAGVPMGDGWAYRISDRGARNVPDSLAPGDVVVLARHGWPAISGEVYAVLLHGRIELGRVAVKGDALVVLLAEGVELLRLPARDRPPSDLRGRVVLVVRGSRAASAQSPAPGQPGAIP